MTSQAQAKAPLAGVVGLAFFGFPLHAAGKPSSERADHLADVRVPMLFLQGSADKLAELDLLKPVVKKLGARATLHLVDGADHSFHVPKRSGRSDREVMAEILDAFAAWAARARSSSASQFTRVNTSSFFNSLKLPSSSALKSCQLVEMVLSPSVPFQAVMVLTQGAKLATKATCCR